MFKKWSKYSMGTCTNPSTPDVNDNHEPLFQYKSDLESHEICSWYLVVTAASRIYLKGRPAVCLDVTNTTNGFQNEMVSMQLNAVSQTISVKIIQDRADRIHKEDISLVEGEKNPLHFLQVAGSMEKYPVYSPYSVSDADAMRMEESWTIRAMEAFCKQWLLKKTYNVKQPENYYSMGESLHDTRIHSVDLVWAGAMSKWCFYLAICEHRWIRVALSAAGEKNTWVEATIIFQGDVYDEDLQRLSDYELQEMRRMNPRTDLILHLGLNHDNYDNMTGNYLGIMKTALEYVNRTASQSMEQMSEKWAMTVLSLLTGGNCPLLTGYIDTVDRWERVEDAIRRVKIEWLPTGYEQGTENCEFGPTSDWDLESRKNWDEKSQQPREWV